MNRIEIDNLPKLKFASSEALNTLATNLFYCGDHIKTIMMTSRYAYEGKSYVTMNLMCTLASLQKKVVLLDTDLRCSRMVSNYQMRFPDDHNRGLAHYLAGICELDDIIYETNVENACIVPIGREISNSLQLLSSTRTQVLMDTLRERFDYVLVDTPPVGVIVDALQIAKYCDGVLLVIAYKRGRRQDVKEVVESINNTGCPVLGSVLNNVDLGSFTNRKYYYKSERYSSYYRGHYMPYNVNSKLRNMVE